MSSPSPEPLWTPSAQQIADARITDFARHVRRPDDDYDALWNWSVTDLPGFWAAIWGYFGLDAASDYDEVLADPTMPGAQWFTGATVNFAEHLLNQGEPGDVALVVADESGQSTSWTRERLRDEAGALAATLKAAGVGRGDVVVGYLPHIAETIVAFAATASLGAIWSGVGQDYVADAAIDRFGQLEPKVLITSTGYHFNGKQHERRADVVRLRDGLPTVTTTIVVERLGFDGEGLGTSWADAVATPAEFAPVRVPFDHPLWVLFSSGTTGVPKGLVHGHGGILVEMLKQLGLHWDLRADDRVFWYTSPSWMMWNAQISALALGASVICYDGSPTFPDAAAMWDLVDEHEVTFFGTSPGYLLASQTAGVTPISGSRTLARLRAMGSTGSPLSPDIHRWQAQQLPGVPLWSISGGTDVCSAFIAGVPTVPVWPGELSVRCLGSAVASWGPAGAGSEASGPNGDGEEVPNGTVGELVLTVPMPSMPVKLWNDPDGKRYRDAYFEMYPHAWRQGDWITITDRGTVVIHGRSDSTLNRHGVRMGSADIYAAVDTVDGIVESLVIGAEQTDGSYWMPLFVVLEPGRELDDELVTAIKSRIRERASARHVPDEVIAVPGIPHTRTGKKLEVPVKRLLQGAELAAVVNPASVDDPSLLDVFAELATKR
ncbi:MAG TPA: acetoacetate--CoA ligase [Gordonia sp. (in: high G+C Gram-positive bacteria)]|uniref:acetoacetate--CoA ligase n=1 Tax=unclassified Gordonia (in: high G+C Gram-positive bacteria) TaxID=2657482 RepID=UPI000FB751DE|nr:MULTISPECIES: acetoacetate--CoA ligase [unclassified Gordonia (in: high G+C Gram-positive bacteria)]RUP41247.1 MAG: acetoacetate--CoA ligase [Gordonia sp. (in: high G+C Gram-positive bacteria)]HNP55549.1 acetoacetate--CoA ligase [Gordonia sp. (in: high G+C Gram-positive bacteria)]HRC51019.1 acetoacetate--CoA ligase [Gordonia sp. (in: high G+C Gram-positive bacteria)]